MDDAHRAPGNLHRAFSVMLVDADGLLLLQRRSAAKSRFPLRWANTCCGHPAPGQPLLDAARTRVAEELGLPTAVTARIELTEAGVALYRAEDPATGRVEHEYDHVLVGRLPDAPLAPDPAEIDALRRVRSTDLAAELAAHPEDYAPWLAPVLEVLADARAGERPAPSTG